ncbi:MAG: aspartate/glutamate racemase family protein [Pseudomonadota bacterium]
MRVAVIHATPLALDPVAEAFAESWPEADVLNILDDTLSRDRAAAEQLTNDLASRIAGLADYAVNAGARGILYSCSAFGPAIKSVARRLKIPVLTPNEAMFAEACASEGNVGLLATFEPSIASMAAEYAAISDGKALAASCVPKALQAMQRGDAKLHDKLLAASAKEMDCDTIMLAQFSTARAAKAVARSAKKKKILSSPGSAVRALKGRMATKATVSDYNIVKD